MLKGLWFTDKVSLVNSFQNIIATPFTEPHTETEGPVQQQGETKKALQERLNISQPRPQTDLSPLM